MFLLLWLSPIFFKFFFLLYCTVKPAARKRIFSAIASSNCHNFLTPAISSSCSPLISGLFWYPYPAGFRIKKFGLSGPPNILFIADATTYILIYYTLTFSLTLISVSLSAISSFQSCCIRWKLSPGSELKLLCATRSRLFTDTNRYALTHCCSNLLSWNQCYGLDPDSGVFRIQGLQKRSKIINDHNIILLFSDCYNILSFNWLLLMRKSYYY